MHFLELPRPNARFNPQSTRNANSYIALNTSTSSSSSTFESSPSGLVSTDHDLEHAPLLPPIRRGKQHKGSLTILPDGRSYTYAYGPPGLAGLWYNGYALACAFFASIGGLEFGYDQGVVGGFTCLMGFEFIKMLTMCLSRLQTCWLWKTSSAVGLLRRYRRGF